MEKIRYLVFGILIGFLLSFFIAAGNNNFGFGKYQIAISQGPNSVPMVFIVDTETGVVKSVIKNISKKQLGIPFEKMKNEP